MNSATLERLLQRNGWFVRPEAFTAEIRRRLPNDFIPRHADLTGFDDRRRAKLIVGPRQAGKSTFVWSRLAPLSPQEVLVIDAEEPLFRSWCASPVQVVANLEREFPSVRTVFIEEAQHLDEAGLFIKGLVDARRDLDILITGSSSYDLDAKTRESLAGRAVRRRLLPLSIAEVVDAEASPIPAVRRQHARESVRRQLIIGGYPEVWTHKEPRRMLSDLVEAFVVRDASDRFRVRDSDAFRRLLQLAAGQVGQMVNYAEWASIAGVAASTVREWLSLLEDTWILRRLPAFAGGKRREITSARRVHFYDMGLCNALSGTLRAPLATRPDRGSLAEGWVFGELSKMLTREVTLHYWRTNGGAEVDFVAVRGGLCVGIEVKTGARARLSRAARSFIDAYAPRGFVIACLELDVAQRHTVGNTTVDVIPLEQVGRVVGTYLSEDEPFQAQPMNQ